MSPAEYANARARGAKAPVAPGWLACTPSLARAGLRATPHPPPGAARGQPTRGGALAPPCASRGDTARQTVLPGPPRSGLAPIAVDVFHETHERATRALASRERVS